MYRRAVRTLLVGTLGVAVILGGCSSAESATGEAESQAAEAQPSNEEQLAALLEVDTSAVPDGATVDQLITIDEAREIIGVPEAFFAVPAG